MDDRTIARGVAAGRLGFGLLVLLAPRLLTRRVGGRTDPPAPYVWWLRAFGIRDAVLGAGTLAALADPDEEAAVRWVQAGALADSADAVTAVVYGRDLDGFSRWATLALAIPASALGWKAAAGLAARR
ncbi:hypothetical protein HC251_02655 [Iamia sp. SCSIO 61187]|uniref:hypothetical protein n=1 Tax=Iamia sp. SCSIO 61187 TaxID=2722752 RepID=UPI001C62C198|nr:hypothetical protein [Iamia sp. SCSIO 61187]QYG91444.1 hypothetical protein HC251_02655 [Iamia sp. SCSIO 61187]